MCKPLAIGPHAICARGIWRLPRYPGVYLICFDQPCTSADGLRVTRHYLGWAANIRQRIEHHRANVSGSKFMQYVNLMGVSYRVTHLWLDATRADERRLKQQKKAWRLCPRCNPALRGGGGKTT